MCLKHEIYNTFEGQIFPRRRYTPTGILTNTARTPTAKDCLGKNVVPALAVSGQESLALIHVTSDSPCLFIYIYIFPKQLACRGSGGLGKDAGGPVPPPREY